MRKCLKQLLTSIEIENRIVINNKVIDKEKVRFNDTTINAVAIYEVSNGQITKVNFIE